MDILNSAPHPIQRIPIDEIRPTAQRHYFGHDQLEELAEQLSAFGLIDPIVVKRVPNGYEIVSGMRRWLAARKLGWRWLKAKIAS